MQSLKNHARYDPPFHFVIFPLLMLNLIFSIYRTIHYWPTNQFLHLWWIVMSIVFIMMAGRTRANALKTQDRIIRLEERIRLATLLPAAEQHYISDFTIQQLIALRFASDAELPTLAHKTLTQNLEPKAIKQNIVQWRPDDYRV